MNNVDDLKKEWYRQRIETIHSRVSAYDILRSNGISLNRADETIQQISCPFHGTDTDPSARIYPSENGQPSKVWCFVCQEKNWDAIGLWRKFNNCTFVEALAGLERSFGITVEKSPANVTVKEKKEDPKKTEFANLYKACESRLINNRGVFDMTTYLKAGSVLDKVAYRIRHNHSSIERGTEVLQALLEKIRVKIREGSNGRPL